jgi:2-keto-4-pentenoate hydratase/2-oxohepta-3-ene-1,7-dioic acid hydratase in catechol pathway
MLKKQKFVTSSQICPKFETEIITPNQRPIPSFPVLFHKSTNSINGPFSPISIPPICKAVDYENELCAIIATDAKDVSEAEALNYVLGYCVGNDVSSREWQRPEANGGQFCFAKSFDGFLPIGPALVAATRIPDPQNLKVTTKVNGEIVQQGNTKDMIFSVAKIIAFLSQGTTIPAGTLIMTGTPAGVAAFRTTPPQFLKSGDVVECEIEGCGSLINKFQ